MGDVALKQEPLPPAQTHVQSEAAAVLSMIERAARDPNVDIAKMERLFEMQAKMQSERARRAFAAALSAAKAEIKPIAKSRTVDFTSAKGRTHYKYEDFALVAEVVDPILAKHGLSQRHRTKQDGGKLHVGCVISHADGYEEETWLSASNDVSGNKNDIQSVASTATYLQRYTLKLALGLAAGPDTDGKAPTPAAQPITPEQIGTLQELVESIDGSTAEFCKHFKIEKIGDLPVARYDFALKQVRERIKNKGGK